VNILVTGIASDIGNAIGRILSESDMCDAVLGCDIHDQHGGKYIFHKCFVVPRADDPNYIETLCQLVEENEIQLIVPSSEPEQRFLLSHDMLSNIGCAKLILPSRHAMEVGYDKLKTARFLEKTDLPYPWTYEVEKQRPKSFPCILKSRTGRGSQDIKLVSSENEISLYQELYSGFIWQELIGSDAEEYTCGVYRSVRGEVRVISFRRRLAAGITSFGELAEVEQITRLCREIANHLNLVGSINIQLRLVDDIPVVFEINPRFSSTVMFRHMMGFQDLIWSIHETLLMGLPEYELNCKIGVSFYKKCEEVVLWY